MTATVREAIEAGMRYLAARQKPDGRWEDFELPVGRSDAWVTAHTGLTLAVAGRKLGIRHACEAARRAGSWLTIFRSYAEGWGYNAVTGPDADSTAYAICLLREVGQPVDLRDEEWLRARWVPHQGFATYDRSDNWGIAHPDVTPVAFRALSDEARAQLQSDLVHCLRASREPDGTWPAYWWRTRHYSTFLNSCLLRELDIQPDSPPPVISTEESRAVYSAFDLAYVLANAWLFFGGASEVTKVMTAELLSLQRPDGSWPGAPILRVARHDAKQPWTHPEGDLFADNDHLFTTASAVRVLAMMEVPWTTSS